MNISKIKPILKAAKIANDVVCLSGKHGIGKSEIVKQYSKENNYFFMPLFLSNQEVGDLIGIPTTRDDKTMVWTKPEWLVKMEEAKWPDVDIEDLEFLDKDFKEFVLKNIN